MTKTTYLILEVDGRALQQGAHQLVRVPGHGVSPATILSLAFYDLTEDIVFILPITNTVIYQ